MIDALDLVHEQSHLLPPTRRIEAVLGPKVLDLLPGIARRDLAQAGQVQVSWSIEDRSGWTIKQRGRTARRYRTGQIRCW